MDDGIGTAEDAAVACEEFHFKQRLTVLETEGQPGPVRLERGEMPATTGEQFVSAAGPAGAEGAIGVIEDPALDCFCLFCIHRNDWLKFFNRRF
jgi:hypothetical protein